MKLESEQASTEINRQRSKSEFDEPKRSILVRESATASHGGGKASHNDGTTSHDGGTTSHDGVTASHGGGTTSHDDGATRFIRGFWNRRELRGNENKREK